LIDKENDEYQTAMAPSSRVMGIRSEDRTTCGDCGVQEGELHHLGCDMERCPFCSG